MNLHISYQPQSLGKEEKANSLLSAHLTKLHCSFTKTGSLSSQMLLIVLSVPRKPIGYSLSELLYRRPFLPGPNLGPETSCVGAYWPVLQQVWKEIGCAVNLLPSPDTHLYDNLADKFILIKDLNFRSLQANWKGPFRVIYSKHLCSGFHWSGIKLCLADNSPELLPLWESQIISPTCLRLIRIPENT